MATGDPADMQDRITATLPSGWFPDVAPVLSGLLAGAASVLASVYSLLQYAISQMRLQTMTEAWLDMFAADYFGDSLERFADETDAAYRARITVNLFRDKVTRAAVVSVLQDLTGHAPLIFEPGRPADAGAWGAAAGWGVTGGWADRGMPFQFLVTARRPTPSGLQGAGGWGASGAWGAGGTEWGNLVQFQGAVTDAAIYAAIASVLPANTIAWTRLVSQFDPGPTGTPTLTAATTSSLSIAWSAPTTGGPPDAYRLRYAPHGSQAWSDILLGAGLSGTLSGLAAAASYDIQIQAVGTDGNSPWSGILTAATV